MDWILARLQEMPIATSVEMGLDLMAFLGVYYGWRLLRGSGIVRQILEVFSWVFVVFTVTELWFPQIWFIELESVPTDIVDTSSTFLIVGGLYALLEVAVLVGLRHQSARDYADVF